MSLTLGLSYVFSWGKPVFARTPQKCCVLLSNCRTGSGGGYQCPVSSVTWFGWFLPAFSTVKFLFYLLSAICVEISWGKSFGTMQPCPSSNFYPVTLALPGGSCGNSYYNDICLTLIFCSSVLLHVLIRILLYRRAGLLPSFISLSMYFYLYELVNVF